MADDDTVPFDRAVPHDDMVAPHASAPADDTVVSDDVVPPPDLASDNHAADERVAGDGAAPDATVAGAAAGATAGRVDDVDAAAAVPDGDVVAPDAVAPDIVAPDIASAPAGADADAAGADADAAEPWWRRMVETLRRPRLTGAGTVIAILIGLLGFALIAQVKSNSNESTLANDRPDDLVRILSDLDARKDRLSTEIATLQGTVRQLTSGAQGRQAALDAAAKRADELGILAGTLPAQGHGLDVTFAPLRTAITSDQVLNAVEELRGAGAEAMSISGAGGSAVRIVAATYFTDIDGGIDVGGQVLSGALTIAVIGDPQTMQTALDIPGGVVETVRNAGGSVTVRTPSQVVITTLHQQSAPRYAQPVS